jgi:hypothetical protein
LEFKRFNKQKKINYYYQKIKHTSFSILANSMSTCCINFLINDSEASPSVFTLWRDSYSCSSSFLFSI